MEITIKDAIPEETGKIRTYITIDDGPMISVWLKENDFNNLSTLESKIEDLLVGKEFIGHTWTYP